LIFKGIDIGFLNLLVSELLKDKRIVNAYSKKPHILLDESILFVMCEKNQDPIKIVQEKIESLKKEFTKLKKDFEKIINAPVAKA